MISTKLWRFFSTKNRAANRPPASSAARSVDAAQAEIESVKADVDSGKLPISVLLPLTLQDCQIIGFILQTFAYADFNGRRALEMLDHLQGAERRTPNRALRDSGVLPSLRNRLIELPLEPQEIQRAETVLDMFERLSVIRHTFAHWAMKRHPTVDALIAMTFNEREAHRRVGHEPTSFTATFGVVPMPEVRANLASLETNDRYLASMVSDWWVRFMPNEGE